MSTLKAEYNPEKAAVLLRSHFGEVENLQPLKGGEASQAYAFTLDGQDLILRVNHHASYNRDLWAAQNINNPAIPIPRILEIGIHDKYYWAVSQRASGKMLYDMPETAVRRLLPQMVDILHAIHRTDISSSSGYGLVSEDGNALYPTWHQFIVEFDIPGDFIDWEKVLQQAEPAYRTAIERAWSQGRKFLKYLPEERVLNHGDYNLANIIATEDRITGVVDWSCVYGDPLRDVAWVDFWAPFLHFPQAYLDKYPTSNSSERLTCYLLFMGARSLGFFVHTRQPHKGVRTLEHVEHIIKHSYTL